MIKKTICSYFKKKQEKNKGGTASCLQIKFAFFSMQPTSSYVTVYMRDKSMLISGIGLGFA